MYAILADLVVAIHVLYVAYVVLGQVVIVIAGTFQRQWGRNRWFRMSHLAAIAFVAYEESVGMQCPLTTWEWALRERAGQTIEQGSFIGRFLHDMLFITHTFSPDSLVVMHYAAAIVVLQGVLLYPPRLWPRSNLDAVKP